MRPGIIRESLLLLNPFVLFIQQDKRAGECLRGSGEEFYAAVLLSLVWSWILCSVFDIDFEHVCAVL